MRVSRSAVRFTTGLNVVGGLAIFCCNVLRQGCELLYAWCYGTLFLGIPLLLLTLLLAPAGTFRAKTLARRLVWGNLAFWALLLGLAAKGVFFR